MFFQIDLYKLIKFLFKCKRSELAKISIFIAMLFLWNFSYGTNCVYASKKINKHILILNSYHQGLGWTDSLVKGMLSVFKPEKNDIDIIIEYMDTKRTYNEQYLHKLRDLYKIKFKGQHLDAIISSDDDAFNFLLRYKDILFPRVPVAFCGVNYYNSSMLQGSKDYTGIVESYDIPNTLETALKLHPNTKKIIVINDRSTTGIANKKILDSVIPVFNKRVKFDYWDNVSMPGLLENIQKIDKSTIVFLMTFNRDKNGAVFSYEESVHLISNKCKVPIYGLWDFYLGHGIIGGKLTNGYYHGRKAAKIALKLLDGEQPNTIQVVTGIPKRYMFDYRLLSKFHLSISQLPPDSIIINKPSNLYKLHKSTVWLATTCFVFLMLLVIYLIINILARKAAEKALRLVQANLERLVDARTTELLTSNKALELEIRKKILKQDALKRSEANLMAIFDTSVQAYALCDLDRRIKLFNKQGKDLVKRVFNVELQQGDSMDTYVFPGCEDEFNQAFNNALERKAFRVEKKIIINNTDVIWFELCANPVMTDDNCISGICLSILNITERKEALNALVKSEERFRSLVQYGTDIFTIISADGTIAYESPALERILGYTPDEMIGQNIFAYIHPDDIGFASNTLREKLKSPGISPPIIFRFKHKNGSWRILEAIGNNLLHDPVINGVVVNSRDITERVIVEQALKDSEEKFRELFNHANDAIWLQENDASNTQVKLLEVNQVACKSLGYSKEELMQIHPYQLIDKEQFPHVSKLKNIVSENGNITFETVLMAKDGHKIHYEISSHAFIFKGKRVTLAIGRDITERKKMADEFLKVEKIRSIGLLAGGIAHDFNNILTVILGSISLGKSAIEKGRIEKVMDTLSRIESITLQAKDLTQQLLTFAKGGTPVKENASISDLLKQSTYLMLRGSNVRCEFSIQDDICPVEMDKGQISQVINNLVINAMQAMPGGGTIRILAANIILKFQNNLNLPEGKYINVSVFDEGVGIPEEHLKNIFDPYFTTKQKGSGLGLTIAYSIIKNHDGLITVQSEQYKGTKFDIYLPASQGETTNTLSTEEVINGSGKILVMDDEEMIRELLAEMLPDLGYTVETAEDGLEAIALYENASKDGKPFDAVIMDLTVPGGMGGKDTIAKLKEINSAVRAIVSSGYSNDPIMSDYQSYGFAGVVVKPYDIHELGKTLAEVLKNKRA